MLIGVVLNYLVPERVFTIVTSVALIGTLWTWGVILVSHATTVAQWPPAASGPHLSACPERRSPTG